MEPNKLNQTVELPEPMESVSPDKSPTTTPEFAQPPATGQAQAAVLAQQPPVPYSQPVTQQAPPIAPAIQAAEDALIADDADLIEKEWVLKAKAIVAQTAHDPNLQTKEMGKVKAEYLKKRYNKTLKQDET